ncbi:alpha/beta fold hydrolase [Hydrogenimonas thermophila]|uniref:alpha/beta hydrolase n=1 Tax=Hydrogenimonas thermophila TaxID=223786 RepID=UPI002936E43F|nr:alpha/beta fold hydrolase [Hydrogenimonas thermophila]WOE69497.1 alpha/beta fold hydrolase [Hydrogenimonas thermophila]WOE72008.1 alpha/beta fold hydrolase [Hydrogenimonas thermophila]
MKLLLLLFLLFILLYPFWVVHKQTLGFNEKIEKRPSDWPAEYEDIYYKTDDNLLLKGWWIPAKSNKAVLLLHGNGGNRNGYHSGVFELGKIYHNRGFNVMLVDLRAHGESSGKRVYFGVKEHKDMLSWLNTVDPKGKYEWYLHGFSMGASTVLMMAESDPERFVKVVADAPWIDFEALVKQELWKRAHLPSFAYSYVKWIAETFFDQDFVFADNRDRCKKLCKKEILYIFESNDSLLSDYHYRLLKSICPSAEIKIFDGVAHVDAFKQHPDRYVQVLTEQRSL